MRRIFIITLLLLLSNNLFAQANWRITATGVGIIELGNSISDTRTQVDATFTTKENERGGFDVYDGTDKLISVWSKRGDGTIGFIKILSDRFHTADGLRTGITIPEVKKIRDDFFLELDEMTEQEYFMPEEFQTSSKEYYSNLNLLYFKSTDGKKLVDKFELDTSTQSLRSTEYRNNGFLEYFYIYQWK